MTNDAELAAITALREATRAVGIGESAVARASASDGREPDVALEVASLLEATAHLLRRTDLDAVPRSGTNHRLHAVVQHLSAGAELARRTTHDDGSEAPTATHPEAGGRIV